MNQSKKFAKKSIAAFAASALVLSGGSTVLAAESGSYKETEKAALEKFASGTADYLDMYAEEYDKAKEGSNSTITLTAEDAGKSMLGMLTSMDFSWLNTVSLDMDVSILESMEAMAVDVRMNDAHLCSMNIMMDLGNLAQYIQMPEFSEDWISVPLTMTDANGEEVSPEMVQTYYNIMHDFMNYIPDSETVSSLINRYGGMIIDNMTEGSSMEEAVSVEGISEDCTVYEGQIGEEEIEVIAEAVLTEARDDEDLKSIFDQWTEAGVATEEQYTQFQSAIDDLLEDLSGESEAETGEETGADTETTDAGSDMLTSKVWVNGDGKIVGREFGMTDGAEYVPLFTWKSPSQDGNSALLVEFSDGSATTLTFTGSGQSTEGLLNGSYVLAYNGVEAADITVENLETNPEKSGYYNGVINVTFPNNGTEESPNPMAAFGLVITLTSDAAAETSQVDLSVTSSGSPLATLSITGGYGDGVEVPDEASFDSALSMASEEDMTAYIQGMKWDTFVDNLKTAGVPEELASQIEAALQSVTDSMSAAETGTTAADGSMTEDPAADAATAEPAPAEDNTAEPAPEETEAVA